MWGQTQARDKANDSVRRLAEPYVHADIAVTPERLDAFAEADLEAQLATLAVLRERHADSGATETTVLGIAVAIIVAVVVPSTGLLDFSTQGSWSEYAGRIIGGVVFALIVVSLVVWGQLTGCVGIVGGNWQWCGWRPMRTSWVVECRRRLGLARSDSWQGSRAPRGRPAESCANGRPMS